MKKLKLFTLIFFIGCTAKDNFYFDFNTFDEQTTLTLKGCFHDDTDCGEWGGHNETILISKEKGKLMIAYKRDTSQCIRRSLAEKELNRESQSYYGQLTEEKQKLVISYINELYTHKPLWSEISNAIDYYEVELQDEFKTRGFKIMPVENEWRKFEDLRNKLINQP